MFSLLFQIAAAAAGPVVDAGVFAAEAQKQAAIASKIAAGMGTGDIDADLALAQKEMKLAESAAGKDATGAVAAVDYAAEAKKDLAIAQKDAPAGAADSAEFAEKEAEIAIRDAGGAGGADEANAQKAIAVAAAHGENDFVSEARRAADQAMEDAELSGKEPDWAGEVKKCGKTPLYFISCIFILKKITPALEEERCLRVIIGDIHLFHFVSNHILPPPRSPAAEKYSTLFDGTSAL